MPLSIYKILGLKEIKLTFVTLQLVGRSITYPYGILEDVLVKFGKFNFPVDFIILYMEEDRKVPIILGRPFLRAARALIDVEKGELTLRVEYQQVTFSIFKALKFSNEHDECFSINVVDDLTNNVFIENHHDDPLETSLISSCDIMDEKVLEYANHLDAPSRLLKSQFECLELSITTSPIKPSIEEPSSFELKPLPNHLRCTFLGNSSTLLIIISSSLSYEQENKLLRVLRDYKKAIGWTIADIKGISPSICMHKILLEENHKATIEHQRRLNLIMKEVVNNEIIKWLDAEKDTLFNFDDACRDAFVELKKRLISAHIFIVFDWNLPFEVMCDVSDYSIGVVLGQCKMKILHPIYYASRTLNEAKANYTITEKKLLAIVFAFDKFRSYLVGTNVIVYTNHAAIKYLIEKKDVKPRLIRWVKPFLYKHCGDQIIRKYVLENEFENILHIAIHLIMKDIMGCQRMGTIYKRHKMPFNILEVEMFYVWRIDIMGPFIPSFNNAYILVAVDCVSKWVEVVALLRNNSRNIFTRFGTPRTIISAEGTHFCNKNFKAILAKYGVKHKIVTAYHT
ncbi:Reverse transcriptase [Theobroma cacao]|nr:Reverse transcriptase [Theobroma cacao]